MKQNPTNVTAAEIIARAQAGIEYYLLHRQSGEHRGVFSKISDRLGMFMQPGTPQEEKKRPGIKRVETYQGLLSASTLTSLEKLVCVLALVEISEGPQLAEDVIQEIEPRNKEITNIDKGKLNARNNAIQKLREAIFRPIQGKNPSSDQLPQLAAMVAKVSGIVETGKNSTLENTIREIKKLGLPYDLEQLTAAQREKAKIKAAKAGAPLTAEQSEGEKLKAADADTPRSSPRRNS